MKSATPGHPSPLQEEIHRQVSLQPQGLSFEEFMGIALYHPKHGYYSRPRPIGKQGDFFTSVSTGPCFGELLARQIRQIQQAWSAPTPFSVIEQGAHAGTLARDILRVWPNLNYRIVEPLPCLRNLQLETLHGLLTNVRQVPHLHNLREPNAVFLCNELLDAFPVRRLHFTRQHWEEWRVVADGPSLRFASFPLEATGFEAPLWLPESAPEGFTLEVCPSLRPWLEDLTSAVGRAVALIIDYGLTREERFQPHRRDGTLRAYRRHQLVDQILDCPGELDLTWHIDFTSLLEAAEDLGWKVLGFTDQARFLTGVATPWLRSLEGQPDHPLLAQFKTLIHPSILGRSFRVLALSKDSDFLELDGFQFARPAPTFP